MVNVRVFDFDGVLVDSLEAHFEFYRDVGKELGVNIDREKFVESLSLATKDYWKILEVPEELIPIFRAKQETHLPHYNFGTYEGIPDLLQELDFDGDLIYLATFNRMSVIEEKLGDLTELFEEIYTGDNRKPKSHALELIMKRHPRDNCLMIGDTAWDRDHAKKQECLF